MADFLSVVEWGGRVGSEQFGLVVCPWCRRHPYEHKDDCQIAKLKAAYEQQVTVTHDSTLVEAKNE
ncbi:hypothetical protein M0R72_16145 [Candidatus Pacearchaeota archaeon]|nr:hypothetical protein [Candidatus Pacearchaeota archaeon]